MFSSSSNQYARDILMADLDCAGFYLSGMSRCKIRLRDVKVIRMLRDIESQSQAAGKITGIWGNRDSIREAIGSGCENLLVHVISKNKHPYAVRVAIWMLGRTYMAYGSKVISRHVSHSNVGIRREVARALRRMRGWAGLREMKKDEDGRVKRLAAPQIQRNLSDRMPKFLRSKAPGIEASGAQPFVIVDSLEFVGRLPKTVQQIRRAYCWRFGNLFEVRLTRPQPDVRPALLAVL